MSSNYGNLAGMDSNGAATADTTAKRKLESVDASQAMFKQDFVCKRRRTQVGWQPQNASPPLLSAATMMSLSLLQPKTSFHEDCFLFLRVMSDNVNDAQLQAQCIRAIRTRLPIQRTTEPAFYDAIIASMKRHPLYLPLQVEGFQALRCHLKALVHGSSECSLRPDGWAVLVDALRNEPSYTCLVVQYLAMDCARLAARDATTRVTLVKEHEDIIALVLGLLHRYPTDARLQELGLSLLSYLVEEEIFRAKIIELSGIDVVIHSMKCNATNSLIHCNGAAALCWLVHLQPLGASDALMNNPHAIPTILDSMEWYLDNASVFGNCICILSGMRTMNQIHRRWTRRLLHMGMRQHLDSLKVQRNCLTMLRLLIEPDDDLQIDDSNLLDDETTLSQSDDDPCNYDGCIDSILASMQIYPDEADIQTHGCRALANLAAHAVARPLILVKEGCINQVITALNRHKTDMKIQQAACWFFHGLVQRGDGGNNAFGGGDMSVVRIMLQGLGVPLLEEPAQERQLPL